MTKEQTFYLSFEKKTDSFAYQIEWKFKLVMNMRPRVYLQEYFEIIIASEWTHLFIEIDGQREEFWVRTFCDIFLVIFESWFSCRFIPIFHYFKNVPHTLKNSQLSSVKSLSHSLPL